MARLVKLQEMNVSPPSPPSAWSAHVFAASTPPRPSIAYPPIYLLPSSDAFTPAPSPLSALLSAHHSSLSKAGIIGGTVAGVITLAVAGTVIATVASNMGLGCLLTPALNVLASLASKLNSCSKFWPQWNSKKDNYEGGGGTEVREIDIYEALGNNPTLAGKAGSADAAAESIETLISTNVSRYAASELRKHESIIVPLNDVLRAASIGDFAASDQLKNLQESMPIISTSAISRYAATELKKQESLPIISTSAISKYAATELNKQESMINEVVRANQMSNYAASELEQQGSVINDVFRANEPITTRMSRYAATESKKQEFTSGGLIETVSEKSVREMGGMKIESTGSGGDNGAGKSKELVATVGGKSTTAGTIIPVREKAMTTWHATAADRGGKAPNTMEPVSLTKSRHPTNLGHVSLFCDISAFRLRCFASCNSGGTYRSAPPCYISNNNNIYNDNYYSNNHSGPTYNQELGNHDNRG